MLLTVSPWIFKTQYISLHVYGLSIFIGLCILLWNISRDPLIEKYNLIDDAVKIVNYSIINGFLGARLLWIYEFWDEISWIDCVTITVPGYSLLGGLIAVVCTVAWLIQQVSLQYRLILVDRLALYAPIVIASGRIGCFFTGCCYGIETDAIWGVCYAHPDVVAPLDILLYPVQLYSAGVLFLLFVGLYFFQKRLAPGKLLIYTLQGILYERFIVDFFRDGRTLVVGWLSLHQVIALSFLCGFYFIMVILFLSDYVQRK